MAKLKARMKAKRAHPRDLVFSNSDGRPQGHFLRMLTNVAYRAGLNCGRCRSALDGREVSCKEHAGTAPIQLGDDPFLIIFASKPE